MTAAPARADVTVQRLARVPRRRDGSVDLDALVDRCGPGSLALLEATRVGHAPRWSYLVPEVAARLVDDGKRAQLRMLAPRAGGMAGMATGADVADLGSDPMRALDAVCEQLGLAPADTAPAAAGPELTGGLVGWFGYELGGRIEPRAAAGAVMPGFDLAVAEHLVAVDHREEEAWLVTRDLLGRRDLRARGRALQVRLATPAPAPAPVVVRPQIATTSLPRARYERGVQRVWDYIAAGDVFQVNLTRQLRAHWRGDALDLYRALRSSPKDGAENIMIVDLLRNDLGRVCRTGSVRVTELLGLEGHPTVWHLVSTVTGTLRPEVGWAALLAATFPCGSVTGAPKIRAQQIIAELEPVPRGVYCGAIGFLSVGAARLSVAIRTATLDTGGRASYGAGGGVVADSDPAAEHQESMDKAAAFLRAVGARLPGEAGAVSSPGWRSSC